MAKSARASTRKANNQRLKKNVFGPVESARTERLSAKLLELASQPKPEKEDKQADGDVDMDAPDADRAANQADEDLNATMDVDQDINNASAAPTRASKRRSSGRIAKKQRKTSKIVFPKYKDRKGKKKA